MKTLIFSLIIILSTTFSYGNDNPKKAIAGLEITTYKTKKLGTHIYITSEFYSEKKIEFINQKGKVILSKKTEGSPIQLKKLKSGLYTVKITENDSVVIVQYEVE